MNSVLPPASENHPRPSVVRAMLAVTTFFGAGGALLIVAAAFMIGHARAFRDMRAALPTAARIPSLEGRLTRLQDQLELSELHATLRNASAEERVHVYVLPREDRIDRTLAFLEVTENALRAERLLRHASTVDLKERTTMKLGEFDYSVQPMALSMTLGERGLTSLFTLLFSAGIVTVGDALTPAEQQEIFQRTETESPTAVVPLEQFLSVDVLAYARDPKPFQERLQRAFSMESFERIFLSLDRASLLEPLAKLLQGPIGKDLDAHNLWPAQFLTLGAVKLQELPDGFWTVDLDLLAWNR